MKQLQRMVAARTAMLFDQPFWGTLSLKLKLVEDSSCETAWTDGTRIGYNPEWIAGLTDRKCRGIVAHETEHNNRGHSWRRGARDHEKWNIACDLAINGDLVKAGFELPEEGYFPRNFGLPDGKSAEWYYDRLPDDAGQDQGQGQPDQGEDQGQQGQGQGEGQGQQGQQGQGQGSGQQKGQKPSTTGKSPSTAGPQGQGQGRGSESGSEKGTRSRPGRSFDEVRDAPQPGQQDQSQQGQGQQDPDLTEGDWRQAVQQAAAVCRGQGTLPGHMEEVVERVTKSHTDWQSVTQRFAQQVTHNDYSWRRPSRRYVPQGLYLPALWNEEVGVLGVGLDTSGSVDQVLLAQFAGVLQAIMDDVKPRKLIVMHADTRVHKIETFEPGDPIVLTAVGRGGTDFRPVFTAMEQLEDPPVAVLYLTDLAGTFPEQDPGIPTLWVTARRDARAVPFGELVIAD